MTSTVAIGCFGDTTCGNGILETPNWAMDSLDPGKRRVEDVYSGFSGPGAPFFARVKLKAQQNSDTARARISLEVAGLERQQRSYRDLLV
jgi:hypothetical protein